MSDSHATLKQADPMSGFAADGFAVFRNVLGPDLVAEARGHVQWLLDRHPDRRGEDLGHDLMTNDPFWVRLISDDRLLDVAQRFVGPNIALFASHYIAKPPFNGKKVRWHQDGSYWPLKPMEVVTLWLAVDDTDPENGCLRVLPGTQNERLLPYDELDQSTDDADVLGSGIRPDSIVESAAVDVRMSAGDVEVHHPSLIHGSNANASARWRRGLTIRYIPASTRIVTDEAWPSAFMLRGEPSQGVNQYQPMPLSIADRGMPFADADAWNEKASRLNARYGL